MLAMGRAMMSQPKLLMLDEPSMGLSPIMTQKIFDTVKQLKEQGTTVLLVEQNALSALALSDYAYVIDLGATTLSGTGRELLADPRVQEAYLGEGATTSRACGSRRSPCREELAPQPGPLAPHRVLVLGPLRLDEVTSSRPAATTSRTRSPSVRWCST
jgi:ABC-type multidrug transport system ATPase subunit